MIELGLADYRPERRPPAPEGRAITLSDFPALATILQPPATAGVTVTEATAIRNAAFFNGVDLISSDVGKLPRHHFERQPDDARERLRGTPVERVLLEPNEYTNALDFWKTLQHLKLTWGNAYAEIEWDRALRPRALHIIHPSQIRPVIENNRLTYLYRGARNLDPTDVIHIRGFCLDGVCGLSIVAQARLSLSLGLAAEQFGASFFGNGAWPGLVFMHASKLSQAAQERMKASVNMDHGGPGKAHKVFVAEEGMKVEKVGIPPEDAQFLETREFQVVEVARWLNLPPHKLKHKMGERPGANLTESELDYLSSCLDTHLVGIEQELDRKLIAPAMRGAQYIEHERNAHLRMLPEKKAESYKAYLDMGVIDPEYIAKKENLPAPKPKPAPAAAPAPAPPPAPQDDQQAQLGDERVRVALRALVADAVGRFARREAEKVRRSVKRGAAGLADLDGLYGDEAMVLRGYLAPAVRMVLAQAWSTEDPEVVAARLSDDYIRRSKEELGALPARNVEDVAGQLVARWETGRPLEVAEALLGDYRGTAQPRGGVPAPKESAEMDEQTVRVVLRSERRDMPPVVIPAPQVSVMVPVPDVKVTSPEVVVNVPPQMAPEVNVNVPAPIVRVDAPVTVNVPPPRPLKVKRDGDGKISGLEPVK